MDDYGKQLDAGVENPVFKASNIGLDESELDYWK